jgi:hypothetical protein
LNHFHPRIASATRERPICAVQGQLPDRQHISRNQGNKIRKQHRYRVIVEHLADENGEPSAYDRPLQFGVGNHDDIFAIVERLRRRGDFDENAAAAFGVGLKLFSEVMLENKDNPLFSSFRTHFAQFMKELKKGAGAGD